MAVDTLKDTLTTHQLDVTIHPLDKKLIELLAALTSPLEFEVDSTVAVYDKESLYGVIDALAELLEERMVFND